MTVFTPTKASGSHFYRYQSAERLERLKPIVLEHLLYVPSVAQLNDPADCRPKIKPMLVEEMVTFLKNDYIMRNPVLALDLLPNRRFARVFRCTDWSRSNENCQRSSTLRWNSFVSIPFLDASTT
jgi:hypothetical protein